MDRSISGGGHPLGQHLQDGPTATRPTYRLIQVLRAVAAVMVVILHSTILLHDRNGMYRFSWFSGNAGVDIFFVISGFVMTVSSAPLRFAPRPAVTFLARRLERIVPLYWIMTTLKIVTLLAAPTIALNALGSPWHIAASYLFIASLNPTLHLEPVLVVGWTLNFEMMFYVLFAAALATRAGVIRVLAPVLLLLGFSRLVFHPDWVHLLGFYTRPLVLEFLGGMLLAHFLPQIRKLPAIAGAVLFLAGFGVLCTVHAPNFSEWRGLGWGLPATATVCGALILEPSLGPRTPRWLLELGDGSYSIYLVHGFVLPIVGLLLAHFGNQWPGAFWVSLFAMVLLSVAAGELVYRAVELPITRWFKGRRRTAVPANA